MHCNAGSAKALVGSWVFIVTSTCLPHLDRRSPPLFSLLLPTTTCLHLHMPPRPSPAARSSKKGRCTFLPLLPTSCWLPTTFPSPLLYCAVHSGRPPTAVRHKTNCIALNPAHQMTDSATNKVARNVVFNHRSIQPAMKITYCIVVHGTGSV